jgi:hypothetical protein
LSGIPSKQNREAPLSFSFRRSWSAKCGPDEMEKVAWTKSMSDEVHTKRKTQNSKLSPMHLFNTYNFKTATLQQLERYLIRNDSLQDEITIPKQEFDNNQPDFTTW